MRSADKPLDPPYSADLKNPLQKEDEGHAGHRARLECEQSAPNSLLNSVLWKTLKTFIKTTTMNLIVNDLLRSWGRALSCVKTVKTSSFMVTAQSWNVSDRLDKPEPCDNVRRHFHRNILGNLLVGRDGNEILGTSITYSGSGK